MLDERLMDALLLVKELYIRKNEMRQFFERQTGVPVGMFLSIANGFGQNEKLNTMRLVNRYKNQVDEVTGWEWNSHGWEICFVNKDDGREVLFQLSICDNNSFSSHELAFFVPKKPWREVGTQLKEYLCIDNYRKRHEKTFQLIDELVGAEVIREREIKGTYEISNCEWLLSLEPEVGWTEIQEKGQG